MSEFFFPLFFDLNTEEEEERKETLLSPCISLFLSLSLT